MQAGFVRNLGTIALSSIRQSKFQCAHCQRYCILWANSSKEVHRRATGFVHMNRNDMVSPNRSKIEIGSRSAGTIRSAALGKHTLADTCLPRILSSTLLYSLSALNPMEQMNMVPHMEVQKYITVHPGVCSQPNIHSYQSL